MLARLISAVCATAALFVGVSAARADTYQISLGEALAIIDVPNQWKVSEIKRGMQIVSPDKEVYIWFEAATPDSMDTLFKEHDNYFEKQGVTIGKAQTQEMVLAGAKTVAMNFAATYKGKRTVVQYLLMDPALKNGAKLVVSNWSSVEGDQKHDKAENAMLMGIKFKKK
ncbi:MAG TPA: hypothetical protein VFB13_05475 [Reyranella sp.]|jgi:hypothetical protein|nr:hypothetical protein [Reyranella sp.]